MLECEPNPHISLTPLSKGQRTEIQERPHRAQGGEASVPMQNSRRVVTEKRLLSNMSIWCLLGADHGPWRPFAVFPLEPREAGAFPSRLRVLGWVPHRQVLVLPPTLPGDDNVCVPLPPPKFICCNQMFNVMVFEGGAFGS